MNNKLKAPVACALLGASFLFAACGDDEPNPDTNNNGGTSNGGTTTGGTAGVTTGGTTPTGGAGGSPATGGAGGAATGGAAGSPGGAGGANAGAGGAGGATAGAGGAPGGAGGMPGGTGGMTCKSPLPMAGMGGMAGAGGMAAGAGGMAAGAGGMAAGAGGMAAGAGGMAAGAGGMAAGAGGAGGAPAMLPRVIATFDMPGSLNMMGVGNWIPGGNPPIPDTVVSRNATEGFSCPGAAEIRVPFTAYNTQQDLQINFNPRLDWTGATMLRAKVKIVMPSSGNLNHLNGVQFAANSKENYSTFQGHYYNASTFADFGWHDVDLPLPGATGTPLDMTQVVQITVQLITPMTAPGTGPAAPVTTTLLLDDVWIQ